MLRFLAFILLAALANACSTHAKILKADEKEVSGEITGSDAEYVHVKKYNREIKIARSEIDDVSHPGKGLMWVGGSITAGSALIFVAGALAKDYTFYSYSYDSRGNLTTSSTTEPNSSRPVLMAMGGIGAAIGILMFYTGYSNYSTSKSNFAGDAQSFLFPQSNIQLSYASLWAPYAPMAASNEQIHQAKVSMHF